MNHYGIYEMKLENVTTYHYFEIRNDFEAQAMGYRKIGEARTAKEAAKMLPENKLNNQPII